MELFGIAFSVPVALVTSAAYSFFLGKFARPRVRLSKTLMFLSIAVLSAWVIEFIAVISFGGAGLNEWFGPLFYRVHLVLFFLAVPSLAAVVMLQTVRPALAKWYIAAVICTVFALIAVLLQYAVSEAIFGID
jgi:hypothetical protein